MDAISTNKAMRRQQFRAAAKLMLRRAESARGTTDRIGQLARAMEQAYAAGAADRDLPTEETIQGGVVRWDALPPRARDVLDRIGFVVKRQEAALRSGDAFAIFQGVSDTAPRGRRAFFSIWVKADEHGLLRPMEEEGAEIECAASSASALVRLGMLAPMKTDTPEVRPAVLTTIGIETVMAAIHDGHVFAPDW